IRTKLHRPPVTNDLVPRTQLLERLEYRRQRPLTLISAPAGYGKSTLVSSWLETNEYPGAWVSLDAEDSDLRLFLTYLTAAIHTLFPEAVQQTQALVNAVELPPQKVLARTLLNELAQIQEPFVLVLDDYHRIRKQAVHDLLEELLHHPPHSLHLVLIVRSDPQLSIPTLRARGQVTEIRLQDLRFSTRETRLFFQKLLPRPLDDQTAEILGKKTEGWVTGLHLAALSLRHRQDGDGLLSELPEDNHYVTEYLVAEVLLQQPAAIQEYLLTTALLDRFCASLCEAVCPDSGQGACEMSGQAFLAWLEQTNLFVIPLDTRQWFCYHHLFQKFLLYRLQELHGPDEIAALHTRASHWFAEQGFLEDAIHHAMESGDSAGAGRLVGQHRHDLINQEQWTRLERWLNRLPRQYIDQDPELLISEAWLCTIKGRWQEALTVAEQVEQLLPRTSLKPVMMKAIQGEINLIRANITIWLANGQRGIDLAQYALDVLPPAWYYARSGAHLMLALGYQTTGKRDKAYAHLEYALEKKSSRPSAYIRLLVAQCLLYWINADLSALTRTATHLVKRSQETKRQESLALGRYFLGCACYQRHDLGNAERHLMAATHLPYILPANFFCQSAWALALTYHASGKPEKVDKIVESTLTFFLERQNPKLLQQANTLQADLALRQGRIAEAGHWAKQFDPKPLLLMHTFYVPQLTFVKILLAQETAAGGKQAAELLVRLCDFVERTHNTRFLIEVLALQALLHNAQGDEQAALEAIERALTLAEPGGFIRLFVDLGPDMACLLRRCLSRKGPVSYIGKILTAFRDERLSPEQEAVSLDQPLTDPVKKSGSRLWDDLLTKREREILQLLAQRLSHQEIAEILFISPKTVKRHAMTIYNKLNVHSRREAVDKAHELGILSDR
ncbi:MAG: AAA family ATPase, partial [bacterium]|nr:AAA family ATPase [bacterium]